MVILVYQWQPILCFIMTQPGGQGKSCALIHKEEFNVIF